MRLAGGGYLGEVTWDEVTWGRLPGRGYLWEDAWWGGYLGRGFQMGGNRAGPLADD